MVCSELWSTPVQSNQALYTDPTRLSDERFQTKPVSWTGDGISAQDDEKDGSSQNENENVSIFCDLRLAQADQIFMVITPNESLASEFKFRWDQKEKRFVEVIGGLMIRYEGLINGVVVSYQLIWSPAVAHHYHQSGTDIQVGWSNNDLLPPYTTDSTHTDTTQRYPSNPMKKAFLIIIGQFCI